MGQHNCPITALWVKIPKQIVSCAVSYPRDTCEVGTHEEACIWERSQVVCSTEEEHSGAPEVTGNVERRWQEAQFWASPKYPQKRLVSFCSFEKAKIQNRQSSAQMTENVQRLKSFSWWHGQTGDGEGCHCMSKLTPQLGKKVERWSVSDRLWGCFLLPAAVMTWVGTWSSSEHVGAGTL